MRGMLVTLVAVALVGLIGSWSPGRSAAAGAETAGAATSLQVPPRTIVLFGHARSLARKGGRWELRLDPAAFLVGVTARRAAVEDGALPPGEPVPNDYYIRDEGHKLLTYLVVPTARITVLTRGIRATRVSVAELALILRGKNPAGRKLFAPRNGFWVAVTGDRVRSMDQQYTP